MSTIKQFGKAGGFAAAAVFALQAPGLQAQDLADAASPFDEIIVTARKREENIQAVPIAVTAFSSRDLFEKNVQTLADLKFVTPSVTVQTDTFRQDTVNLTIRGIRNFPSNGVQFDSAAAVYVNGIYIARTQGLTGTLFDIDSVQVLKGPQGTLLGRNATGGAVLYTTREPEESFGGHASLTGGDYGRREGQFVVNVPITDKVFARAGVSFSETGGYLKNIFYNPVTGERNDTPAFGSRKLAGLFSVKFVPDETTKVVLRGDFDSEHHTGHGYHSIAAYEGTLPSTGAVGSTVTPVSRPSICNIPLTCNQFTDLDGRISGPYYSDVATRTVNTSPLGYNTILASLARQAGDFWSIDQARNAYNEGHFQNISGTVDKDFGDVTVKLLGGYRWTSSEGKGVTRGAPYFSMTNDFVDPDYDAYTAELSATGNQFDNKLDWTTGLFFFQESANNQGVVNRILSPHQVRAQPVTGRQITETDTTGSSGKNTSYAGYAQVTYSVLPDLRVTGGVRYTIDKRRAHITNTSTRYPATATSNAAIANSVFDPSPFVFNGITYSGVTRSCALTDGNGVLRPFADCFFDVERKFKKPTWTVSLDYDLMDDTLVYFTARKGYRSGAINSGATNAAVTVAQPENVQDYEIGLKSDWYLFDMPVRSNFAGYLTNYRNIQVQNNLPYVVFAVGPGGVPCTQAIFNAGQCSGATSDAVTLNAKSARLYGGEWDISLKPTSELTLSWNGSYMRAKYTDFSFTPPPGYLQPATGSNLTGKPFPLPAWTMSGVATYALGGERLGLPVEHVALTASASYQGDYRTDMTGYNPGQKAKGYTFINLLLSAENIAKSNVAVSGVVSNLFNKKACMAEAGGSGAGVGAGVLTSTPNPTFGVPNTSGVIQCPPYPPRMFAMTVKYVF
jgi:iron complex outermembrane receptor protein